MGQYDRKNLCSIEKALAEGISDNEVVEECESDCLSEKEVNALTKWAEETLGSKVKKVKVSFSALIVNFSISTPSGACQMLVFVDPMNSRYKFVKSTSFLLDPTCCTLFQHLYFVKDRAGCLQGALMGRRCLLALIKSLGKASE